METDKWQTVVALCRTVTRYAYPILTGYDKTQGHTSDRNIQQLYFRIQEYTKSQSASSKLLPVILPEFLQVLIICGVVTWT